MYVIKKPKFTTSYSTQIFHKIAVILSYDFLVSVCYNVSDIIIIKDDDGTPRSAKTFPLGDRGIG